MRWFFRLSPGPRALPAEVRADLTARFQVAGELVERARLVAKLGEHHCQQILIYDPLLMGGVKSAIKKYEDLAIHKHAVLFEGRIEKDGSLYLADRRQPKTVTRRPSRITAPSPKPDQAT